MPDATPHRPEDEYAAEIAEIRRLQRWPPWRLLAGFLAAAIAILVASAWVHPWALWLFVPLQVAMFVLGGVAWWRATHQRCPRCDAPLVALDWRGRPDQCQHCALWIQPRGGAS